MFYKPLSKEEIFNISDLLLEDLRKRLKAQQLDLELTDVAKDYLVEAGYDPTYGARPLKRFIQSNVETLIARLILQGNLSMGSTLVVDYTEDKLTVKAENRKLKKAD